MSQGSTIEVCDETFYEGFNGKFDFSGGGERFRLAFEWIMSETQPKVIMHKVSACIAFSEKPRDFLISGKTKSMKGDGNGVNETILALLPKHPAEWYDTLASGTYEERNAHRIRSSWPASIQLLNMSMVKTVSLMWMECVYNSSMSEAICKAERQWMSLYGQPPSSVMYSLEAAKGNHASFKIKAEEFDKFKFAQSHWDELINPLSDRRDKVIAALSSSAQSVSGSNSSVKATSSNSSARNRNSGNNNSRKRSPNKPGAAEEPPPVPP
jgi:hypothetical protein